MEPFVIPPEINNPIQEIQPAAHSGETYANSKKLDFLYDDTSYSFVFPACAFETKGTFIIKKLVNPLDALAIVERSVVLSLQKEPTLPILQVHDWIEAADEFYIVYKLPSPTRFMFTLRSYLTTKTLAAVLIETFSLQLLQGVKFFHDKDLVHGALAPEYILLIDANLKIGHDLTRPCARTVGPERTGQNLPLPYRSPEHLLQGYTACDRSIDIWSCACIIGEMICGKPLFPSTHFGPQAELAQLTDILRVFGITAQASATLDLSSYRSKRVNFDQISDSNDKLASSQILDGGLRLEPAERLSVATLLHLQELSVQSEQSAVSSPVRKISAWEGSAHMSVDPREVAARRIEKLYGLHN